MPSVYNQPAVACEGGTRGLRKHKRSLVTSHLKSLQTIFQYYYYEVNCDDDLNLKRSGKPLE